MTAKKRLNAQDWLVAGFQSLTKDGPDTLKAEALARSLGTTKGSFYWHFKDVPDFHTKMLAMWEDQTLAAMTEELAQVSDPVKRLYHLGEPSGIELVANSESAIRAWAYGSDLARDALERVDHKRVEILKATLAKLDLTNPDFVRIIHAAIVGMSSLQGADKQASRNAMSTLMAALLALRDA